MSTQVATTIELREVWIIDEDSRRMTAKGDAERIDRLLTLELIKVANGADGWSQLYQHRSTGKFWELDYPESELHGGGPRRLRELDLAHSDEWDGTASR
jgi:hypothetical protein